MKKEMEGIETERSGKWKEEDNRREREEETKVNMMGHRRGKKRWSEDGGGKNRKVGRGRRLREKEGEEEREWKKKE